MESYVTGIIYWNKEKRKWSNTCLPLTSKRTLIPTKTRVTRRAISFGLKPTGNWKLEENIHYREFETEFSEKRRAFIIRPRKLIETKN